MQFDTDSLAVITSAAVASLSLLTGIFTQVMTSVIESRRRKKEMYIDNQMKIYNEFINAYSNLHGLKSVEEQRTFLSSLYAAMSIAPPELRCELEKLLPMDSNATIKQTEENRMIFLSCVNLINKHNRHYKV